MRDTPDQAQAKSFFHCKFGHEQVVNDEEKKKPKSSILQDDNDFID